MRPILENHLPHVYRYALRLSGNVHAAEDLAQEAFVRAWERQDRMADPHEIRVWLLRVTANLWRDEIRKVNTQQRHQLGVAVHAAKRQFGAKCVSVEERESAHHALDLLDRLPERQREVLYLSACEGLTPGEIGSILNVSNRAVIASLSIARQKVREMKAPQAAVAEVQP